MSESPYISAATAADFTTKVIQRSNEVPVLVDFWAEWCGPCRSLTPLLHEVVEELKGAILLVTVDTDQEIELARSYQIRSLPTVKLFRGGEIVDEFMGALPGSRIRAFLEPYVARESDHVADQAEQIAGQGDRDGAEALYLNALQDDPVNLRVRLRYARFALDTGKLELATELLNAVPVESVSEPAVQRLRAMIDFRKLIDPNTSDNDLETKALDPSPAPAALRELAARKVLKGDYAEAMDLQLRLMKADRYYGDNAAQKDLLAVFELVDDPELIGGYRRLMYNLLH